MGGRGGIHSGVNSTKYQEYMTYSNGLWSIRIDISINTITSEQRL